jgi:hypothetical protein
MPSVAGGRAVPAPRATQRIVVALLLLCALLLSPAAPAADGEELLPALKVAYVYNFTRFVQWPARAPEGPFVICVIGEPAMETHLRALEREQKQVDGRPIAIRRLERPDGLEACQILFVGAAAGGSLDAIVRGTAGKPILLVGDTPGFAGRGVAIELLRKPDIFGKSERLRFRIDPAALKDRGLTVSAQLYDVADVVR